MADTLASTLSLAASCFDSYRSDLPITVAEHVRTQLANTRSEEMVGIITNIITGCLKYPRVINGIILPFSRETKRTFLRRDLRLLQVLSYYLLFLQKKHSNTATQAALHNLYSFAVRKFLHYFVGADFPKDQQPMHTLVKQNWYENFDREFVDKNFYNVYCQNEETLRAIVFAVESLHNSRRLKKRRSVTINVEPFRLQTSARHLRSEARLAAIPGTKDKEQEALASQFKAHVIPKTTYAPSERTLHQQKMADDRTTKLKVFKKRIEDRQQSRERAKKEKNKPNQQSQRIRKTPYTLAEVLQQRIPTPHFNPSQDLRTSKKVTVRTKPPAKPVKQTTTALLREKALFQKHKDVACGKADELAAGAWDPEAHENRFRKLEEKDLEAAIVENERKIVDGMQALEKAISAKRAYDEETKQRALAEKEMKKGVQEQRQLEMAAEIQELRAAVEQAQAVSKMQLHEAKRRVLEEKQQKAHIVKEENNELLQRYLDQREQEMLHRKEIIAQIHEMEARLISYEKTFDFGEVSKYGFLSDLSLADLKDRLISLRFEVIDQTDRKRRKILDEKETVKQGLDEAKRFVGYERSLWGKQKKVETEKTRQQKQLRRDHLTANIGIKVVLETLVKQSQERRRMRVNEREARLHIKDKAWDDYVFL